MITLAPGTYYLAVSQFANLPSGLINGSSSLVRPDLAFGGQLVNAISGNSAFGINGPQSNTPLGYTLNVSVENTGQAVAAPAPATLFLGLFAAGFTGLTRVVRRKVAA